MGTDTGYRSFLEESKVHPILFSQQGKDLKLSTKICESKSPPTPLFKCGYMDNPAGYPHSHIITIVILEYLYLINLKEESHTGEECHRIILEGTKDLICNYQEIPCLWRDRLRCAQEWGEEGAWSVTIRRSFPPILPKIRRIFKFVLILSHLSLIFFTNQHNPELT